MAGSAGTAALITTEKDAVRLEMLASGFPANLPLKIARLRIEIENQTEVLAWFVSRVSSRSANPPL
jgi:tetraacyldisaccharide-1-P 4'-kinase